MPSRIVKGLKLLGIDLPQMGGVIRGLPFYFRDFLILNK